MLDVLEFDFHLTCATTMHILCVKHDMTGAQQGLSLITEVQM